MGKEPTVTVSDVDELHVPPRRFWVRVGSEILAEGIKWNGGSVAFHWPGHPINRYRQLVSMDELMQAIADWGWSEAHVVWIDDDPDAPTGETWHVAGELADHGAAGCQGVGR
jgi:hypothetical protein